VPFESLDAVSYSPSIPERDGRTDRQTNGQTELLYQNRASVCRRAIKTRKFTGYCSYVRSVSLHCLIKLGGVANTQLCPTPPPELPWIRPGSQTGGLLRNTMTSDWLPLRYFSNSPSCFGYTQPRHQQHKIIILHRHLQSPCLVKWVPDQFPDSALGVQPPHKKAFLPYVGRLGLWVGCESTARCTRVFDRRTFLVRARPTAVQLTGERLTT